MRSVGLLAVLAVLLLAGFAGIRVSPVYGTGVQDCLDLDIGSCDFPGFSTMCQRLYSNPQPCDKLCKSTFSGGDVGACLICCSSVKAQLGLPQTYEVERE